MKPRTPVLGAGDADEHLVFHHERRCRPAVAVPVRRHRRVPLEHAGLPTDRDDVRVERRLEQTVAEDSKPAIDEAAARDESARQVAAIAPDLAAAARIDRPPGVERSGHVDDAVEHERRRFELAEGVGLELPLRGQTMDVLRCDLRQRAVPVIGVVAGVGEPARRVLQTVAEILCGEFRRRRLLRVERAGDDPAGDECCKGDPNRQRAHGVLLSRGHGDHGANGLTTEQRSNGD